MIKLRKINQLRMPSDVQFSIFFQIFQPYFPFPQGIFLKIYNLETRVELIILFALGQACEAYPYG